MAAKGPHFVQAGEPRIRGAQKQTSTVEVAEITFHEALIAILDKRNVTEENILVLEGNLCRINIQKLLDTEKGRLRLEEESMHENTLNKKVLDIKSRIIESFKILNIPFALGTSPKGDDVIGDTRIIDVNHNMIRGLREYLEKK